MDENIVESIPDEVDVFAPILQQNIIKDEFDQEYLPVNAIQAGAPIEFSIKSANDHYFDLDESRMIVTAKITKANGTDMDNNIRAAPVNLMLHSMFREIDATLNDTPASDPNSLYPYRAYLETLLNYSEEVQKNRLLTEGWVKDTAGQMAVTDLAGANIGLKDRATRSATSTLMNFVGRPHLDIFHQGRLISPNVALRIKLIPSSNQFVCISAPPAGQAVQEQFKVVIQNVTFMMRIKKLADSAHLAIMQDHAHEDSQATLHESSSQASYYPRKRYHAGLRRDIRRSPAGPSRRGLGCRRGFRWPLQPEPFQFPSVQRESYGAYAQWRPATHIRIHSKLYN